jgi:hypothetical protein
MSNKFWSAVGIGLAPLLMLLSISPPSKADAYDIGRCTGRLEGGTAHLLLTCKDLGGTIIFSIHSYEEKFYPADGSYKAPIKVLDGQATLLTPTDEPEMAPRPLRSNFK